MSRGNFNPAVLQAEGPSTLEDSPNIYQLSLAWLSKCAPVQSERHRKAGLTACQTSKIKLKQNRAQNIPVNPPGLAESAARPSCVET